MIDYEINRAGSNKDESTNIYRELIESLDHEIATRWV